MTRHEMSGRDRECADRAAEYGHLREAIRASAARGDERAEERLRNRAQAVLGRLRALDCPMPDAAELGT